MAPPNEETMANILVRRDQFNITPDGIVHKPTDAAFTPYPGDPHSGITRLGHRNGTSFSPEVVRRGSTNALRIPQRKLMRHAPNAVARVTG